MVFVSPLLALLVAATPAVPSTPLESFQQVVQQANAARTANRPQDAIRLYRRGVGLRPSWSEGWWWLGSLLYEQDRFPEAESAFRRFVPLTSKPGPAYAFLGLCEYETREYDHALQHLRVWASQGWAGTPDLIDVAAFHMALLLTRQGRFVEALYLLATEGGRSRSGPALAEVMGLASLRMASLPEEYPPQRREMVWLAGQAALHASLPTHELGRADEYSRRLLLHYSGEPEVHYFRGQLLNLEEKRDEAEREFQEELRISPRHVPAMLELVRMNLDGRRMDEAESLARRAAELDPGNAETHHWYGRVLLAGGQTEASARELENAKQLAPDSATIRSHLAEAYRQLGRTQQAKREAAAFLSLKKKEEVLAPPEAKTSAADPARQPK
jgi:tetratricopeptide (TPR) repeat protein